MNERVPGGPASRVHGQSQQGAWEQNSGGEIRGLKEYGGNIPTSPSPSLFVRNGL